MTRPRKNRGAGGVRTRDLPLPSRTPLPLGQGCSGQLGTVKTHPVLIRKWVKLDESSPCRSSFLPSFLFLIRHHFLSVFFFSFSFLLFLLLLPPSPPPPPTSSSPFLLHSFCRRVLRLQTSPVSRSPAYCPGYVKIPKQIVYSINDSQADRVGV